MRRDSFRSRRLSFLLVVGLGLSGARDGWAREEAPRLEFSPSLEASSGLEARTRFWIDALARYSQSEAVVHDRDHPWIVFAVVPLEAGGAEEIPAIRRRYSDLADRVARALARPDLAASRRLLAPGGALYGQLGAPIHPRRLAEARGRIAVLPGQREVFAESLVRSKAYIDGLKRVLREAGLPEDLAYLPHVESSFDAQARSPAGAAGLWQLMPATARESLRVDGTVDERTDPYKATVAAARYLRAAYTALGSWPLAVTSYHHGVSGTQHAVDRTRTRDLAALIDLHTSSSFGYAGRNFYARFLASVYVARNSRFFFPGIERRAAHEYVVRKGDTLWRIARRHGTTVQALRSTNRRALPASAQLQLGQRLLIYG